MEGDSLRLFRLSWALFRISHTVLSSGQIVPRNLAGGNIVDIDMPLVDVTVFLLEALTAIKKLHKKIKKI